MFIAMARVGDGSKGKTFPIFQIEAGSVPQAQIFLSFVLEKYGIKTERHDHNKLVQKKDHTETFFWVHELGVINDLGWLKAVEEFQRREEDQYWKGLASLNMNP